MKFREFIQFLNNHDIISDDDIVNTVKELLHNNKELLEIIEEHNLECQQCCDPEFCGNMLTGKKCDRCPEYFTINLEELQDESNSN